MCGFLGGLEEIEDALLLSSEIHVAFADIYEALATNLDASVNKANAIV